MHCIPFLPLALCAFALVPLQLPRDLSKREVELPLERALELASPAPALGAPAARATAAVQPGLVRWHADLAAARAAARDSGKPVLLFQLFGRLDDELC